MRFKLKGKSILDKKTDDRKVVVDCPSDGGLQVGDSAASGVLSAILVGSETKDWGSIDDGNELAEEVTVAGAALGDLALASMSVDVADLMLSASVTAANTVTVVLANNTGGAVDLGSGTLKVAVLKVA